MTRAEHKRLASEILAAVGEIAESHGYVASQGAGRYDPDGGGTFKLELALIAEDGSIVTKERLDYIANAEAHWSDMAPEWLDKTFKVHGREFTVTGWRRRARKRPVETVGVDDGKTYLFEERTVVTLCTMLFGSSKREAPSPVTVFEEFKATRS